MKRLKVDSHADTIQYCYDKELGLDNINLSFNVKDVLEYLPYIQCLSCFVHDKYLNKGYERVNQILDYYNIQLLKNKDIMYTITSKNDICKVIENNMLGVILTVENGVAIDNNIDNIYNLYEKGIRMMTLTWNGDNQLGCGTITKCDNGLTSFGKTCINKMNNINMIIDISHASTKTFWDTIVISNKPIIASHSNVYTLCKHKRNLTDIQIKEIAKNNGLIGVNYCSDFLVCNKKATIQDVVNHIVYISNLIGTEYVCLGSDFDGVDKNRLPENLKGVKDITKLEECMLYNGFSKEEIQNIMGDNMKKFLINNLN